MTKPCSCGRLHSADLDRVADELADAVIEGECCRAVEGGLVRTVTASVMAHLAAALSVVKRRRRPRRVPDFDDYYRFLAPYEARMKRSLNRVWDEQRRTIVANMKRTPKAARFDITRKDLTFDELIEQWMFPKGPANKTVQVVYKDLALKLMVAAAVREMQTNPAIATNWDVFNPNVEKWVASYSIELADEINTATLDKLKRSLYDGWKAGESIPDLTNRVRDLYEEFERYRAASIARTESIRSSSQAAKMTYEASGVVDRIGWASTPDERECELCAALDGKVVPLGEAFFVDNFGDGTTAPRHVNCRCANYPVLEGETL